MQYKVSFRPEIPSELASAANWYDDQRAGLGEEFLCEYHLALDALLESPHLHAPDEMGIRFRRLKRFPYRICYRVIENEILVAAVFHAQRDPKRLLDRQ